MIFDAVSVLVILIGLNTFCHLPSHGSSCFRQSSPKYLKIYCKTNRNKLKMSQIEIVPRDSRSGFDSAPRGFNYKRTESE